MGGGGKPGLLFTFCVTKNLGELQSESGWVTAPRAAHPPPHCRAPPPSFLALPTPLCRERGGRSELGKGLSGALKGSLSKGGRVSLGGWGAEGRKWGQEGRAGMGYWVPGQGPRPGFCPGALNADLCFM